MRLPSSASRKRYGGFSWGSSGTCMHYRQAVGWSDDGWCRCTAVLLLFLRLIERVSATIRAQNSRNSKNSKVGLQGRRSSQVRTGARAWSVSGRRWCAWPRRATRPRIGWERASGALCCPQAYEQAECQVVHLACQGHLGRGEELLHRTKRAETTAGHAEEVPRRVRPRCWQG